MQRGESERGLRRQIRACLDKGPNNIDVPFCGGPHQRGLMLRRLCRVHIGATAEQQANGGDVTASGARHQRRLTGRDRRVGMCSRVQEQRHERSASVRACLHERRHAEIVRRIHIGAGTDQQFRGLQVVPMCGPQERRRAVLGPDIHVGVPVEQRPHLLRVLILRGVDQPQLCACGRCTDNQEQRRGEREPDTCASASIYHGIPGPHT